MITLCKCGAMTTPGEKYCKSCYIDTLKDDVGKNIFAGGRFYERRNMREKIKERFIEVCGDVAYPTDNMLNVALDVIYEEIRGRNLPEAEVERIMANDPNTILGAQMVAHVQLQKILSLLRPNNVVGNAEL